MKVSCSCWSRNSWRNKNTSKSVYLWGNH